MEIYHERQHLQFCLLHALNNLLQGHETFTKQTLNTISDKLESETGTTKTFLAGKTHRNRFTGNYDANVLLAACASRDMDVRWHDRRIPVSDADVSQPDLVGVIVNAAKRHLLGWWKGRHWITLRVICGRWYNLDSDLREPVVIHNPTTFLNEMLKGEEAEVFFVMKPKR